MIVDGREEEGGADGRGRMEGEAAVAVCAGGGRGQWMATVMVVRGQRLVLPESRQGLPVRPHGPV